jgi:signal transduction histidine kinase/CheY-like chemotaxis protein
MGDPVNPENSIVWTNEFRQMLGYSDENDFPNVLNSWSDVLHPDDKERTVNALSRHILDVTGKTPFDVEYQMLKKNGVYSHFRATGETIRDENGVAQRVAGALMDITDAKNLLDELKKKQAEAEAASRTKSVFLANMSHEIRTPMNSILGFSELAQDDDIPKKTREYLENIQDSAKWLLKIINDILDISKIESGKVTLERIPFNLPDVFEHCQSNIKPIAAEKGITLYSYAEPSVGKMLLGDPVRLRQVLTNLLTNAIKFTNIGTVKLLASIKEKSDDTITIAFEIKDSGIGMNTEQIKKVFEPFIQADDSVTRRFGGTGLGLPIVKNIIELMGGTLDVESVIGVGSKFRFVLTFDMVDDAAAYMISDTINISKFEKPNFTGEVLVCEDNNLNQQVICAHLAKVGLKTVVANNGKEGVEILDQRNRRGLNPFDLIFMDIHMPVMDGLDAASKAINIGIKTPIIALTANVMSNDLELYKEKGMSDYLGKPFTTQELWKCLVKYIPVDSYTSVDKHHQSAEEERMLKLLKINFVKNNQETYNKLVMALNSNDKKTAHRLVHTLKGNAGQIGEKQLQVAAQSAEKALSDGMISPTEKPFQNLEAELIIVLNKLTPLLSETTRAIDKSEPVDTDRMLEIFDRLEPLLKSKDTECLSFIDDLYSVPGAEELIKQIEGYRYKHALTTLDNLRKNL